MTDYDLQRNEVVALFNAFGRLSHSIVFLENFQRLAIEEGSTPVKHIKNPYFLKPELWSSIMIGRSVLANQNRYFLYPGKTQWTISVLHFFFIFF